MTPEDKTCCKSKPVLTLDKTPTKKGGWLSFVSAALIIVLPKCPFCIAAYSGAMMMFYEVDSASLAPIFMHLKPLLGLLVLTSILLNFKGKKSKIAVSITVVAFALLLLEVYANEVQPLPAVGRALYELVAFGEYRTLDLARFGYRRVCTGEGIHERNNW